MILKIQYIDSYIHQPKSGRIINVKSINPTDYPFYFNNGYQHLFEEETPIEETTNDISNTQSE